METAQPAPEVHPFEQSAHLPDDALVKVTRLCVFCNKPSYVTVKLGGMRLWRSGLSNLRLQEIFPELSLDDRETLISGSHGACFDAAFSDEDEPADSLMNDAQNDAADLAESVDE